MLERLPITCVIAALGTCLMLAGPLVGCSSGPKADATSDPAPVQAGDRPGMLTAPGIRASAASAPPDFWISLTVAGPSRAGGLAATPRAMRPARYVMEADRQLRSSVGLGASESTFPPALRRLSDEQVGRLWRIVEDGGLMGPNHPSRAKGMIVFDTLPQKTMYVLNISAEGERRQLLIDGEDPAAPGRDTARALADTLAELSWLDQPPAPTDGATGIPEPR